MVLSAQQGQEAKNKRTMVQAKLNKKWDPSSKLTRAKGLEEFLKQ
jgi:hypothetical protein